MKGVRCPTPVFFIAWQRLPSSNSRLPTERVLQIEVGVLQGKVVGRCSRDGLICIDSLRQSRCMDIQLISKAVIQVRRRFAPNPTFANISIVVSTIVSKKDVLIPQISFTDNAETRFPNGRPYLNSRSSESGGSLQNVPISPFPRKPKFLKVVRVKISVLFQMIYTLPPEDHNRVGATV